MIFATEPPPIQLFRSIPLEIEVKRIENGEAYCARSTATCAGASRLHALAFDGDLQQFSPRARARARGVGTTRSHRRGLRDRGNRVWLSYSMAGRPAANARSRWPNSPVVSRARGRVRAMRVCGRRSSLVPVTSTGMGAWGDRKVDDRAGCHRFSIF